MGSKQIQRQGKAERQKSSTYGDRELCRISDLRVKSHLEELCAPGRCTAGCTPQVGELSDVSKSVDRQGKVETESFELKDTEARQIQDKTKTELPTEMVRRDEIAVYGGVNEILKKPADT